MRAAATDANLFQKFYGAIMAQPLFKYIGNKYRSAEKISSLFPSEFDTYYEPFFGSGAVLGRVQPNKSVVSDTCKPLIDLWMLVQRNPQSLLNSYTRNWESYCKDRQAAYDTAKDRFNHNPNPHDFLFVSRACYGGVIRFRRDGYLSTPMGPHRIISPTSFAARLRDWALLVRNTKFVHGDFSEIVAHARSNDVIYCDPPYVDTQKILYGAQDFDLMGMYRHLSAAKSRGAFVALSIDGMKRSGDKVISILPPNSLFEVEMYLNLGGSMLKRFWRGGGDVLDEHVKDRLLLSREPDVRAADLFESRPRLAAIG